MDYEAWKAHDWEPVGESSPGLVLIENELGERTEVPERELRRYERRALKVLDQLERLSIRDEAQRLYNAQINPPPAFEIVSSVDDAALAEDEMQHLVGRFLPLGSIVLFSATAKAGKTTFLQSFALALANGERRFLGFDVIENYERSVLYLNLDEDPRQFRWQIRKLGPHERFKVLHQPGGAIDFTMPQHVDTLVERCVSHGVGVVIVDVWSSAFSGEENSNTEVIAGWNGVQVLRATAKLDAVIVAHHAGHARQGEPRGASSFAGKVDVLWSYVDRNGGSYFSVKKGRGVSGVPEFRVDYDYGTHQITRGASRSEERAAASAETEESIQQRILDAVSDNPGINGAVLQATVGGKREVVTRIRRELVDAGGLREERLGNARIFYPAS